MGARFLIIVYLGVRAGMCGLNAVKTNGRYLSKWSAEGRLLTVLCRVIKHRWQQLASNREACFVLVNSSDTSSTTRMLI
ncbi:hypothetical protein J6590_030109 [Homalodisca vitripennis]|nr:hypothetical protein J6590_030109 [Homalodisca vitripennis]